MLGPDSVVPTVGSESAGIGTAVDRYVVIEELGRGAMGRVLRAYDPKLCREVALKEVRGNALGEEGQECVAGSGPEGSVLGLLEDALELVGRLHPPARQRGAGRRAIVRTAVPQDVADQEGSRLRVEGRALEAMDRSVGRVEGAALPELLDGLLQGLEGRGRAR